MPALFDRFEDFDVYLSRFNAAAYLSRWCFPGSYDYRPHYLSLPLKGKGLYFVSPISEEHHHDFDLLVDAFCQNYLPNVETSETRSKATKQEPRQDITNFICDIRTLKRGAYSNHPHVFEKMAVSIFIKGLNSSTFRWEL